MGLDTRRTGVKQPFQLEPLFVSVPPNVILIGEVIIRRGRLEGIPRYAFQSVVLQVIVLRVTLAEQVEMFHPALIPAHFQPGFYEDVYAHACLNVKNVLVRRTVRGRFLFLGVSLQVSDEFDVAVGERLYAALVEILFLVGCQTLNPRPPVSAADAVRRIADHAHDGRVALDSVGLGVEPVGQKRTRVGVVFFQAFGQVSKLALGEAADVVVKCTDRWIYRLARRLSRSPDAYLTRPLGLTR